MVVDDVQQSNLAYCVSLYPILCETDLVLFCLVTSHTSYPNSLDVFVYLRSNKSKETYTRCNNSQDWQRYGIERMTELLCYKHSMFGYQLLKNGYLHSFRKLYQEIDFIMTPE